jgi:hypothetical protein
MLCRINSTLNKIWVTKMGRHHGKYDRSNLLPGNLVDIEGDFYDQLSDSELSSINKTINVVKTNNSLAVSNIWNSVSSLWDAITTNTDAAMELIHESYIGWFYQDQTPDDKNSLRAWIEDSIKNRKTGIIRISPVGESELEDVITVHYHYLWIYYTNDGSRHKEKGKYSETYKQYGSKWLLISDHGGPID